MTNDEKVQKVQKRKVLKALIIIFSILTIFFSVLSLWKNITPLFALVFFIIEVIISKYREKLDPKEEKK